MNNERHNPNLTFHLRNFKPPKLTFENKENEMQTYFHRDGYSLNSRNAQWGFKNFRTHFTELNNVRKK